MEEEKLIKKIKELATIETVTAGINGYPVPEIGLAIVPNEPDDYMELKKLLPDMDKYVFHSRNGWALVEKGGPIYDEYLTLEESDYADNVRIIEMLADEHPIECAFFERVRIFGYNSVEEMAEAEDMEAKELQDNIDELADNLEPGYNMLSHGEFYEHYPFELISFNYDTHNYMLGFFIDKEDEQQAKIVKAHYKD